MPYTCILSNESQPNRETGETTGQWSSRGRINSAYDRGDTFPDADNKPAKFLNWPIYFWNHGLLVTKLMDPIPKIPYPKSSPRHFIYKPDKSHHYNGWQWSLTQGSHHRIEHKHPMEWMDVCSDNSEIFVNNNIPVTLIKLYQQNVVRWPDIRIKHTLA